MICTGFNVQAPKLVFSHDRIACRGVLDPGSADQEAIGGPIFIKMMTPKALRTLHRENVVILTCGFEHCFAITASG